MENSEDMLKIDKKLVTTKMGSCDQFFAKKNIDRPKLDKKERSKSETTGFGKFYFGQKLVTRSSFCGHKFFTNFEHIF